MRKLFASRLHIAMAIVVACALFGPLAAYAQLTSTSHDAAAAVAHNWLKYNNTATSHNNAIDSAEPALQELLYQGQLVGYVASQGDGYVVIPAYSELPPVTAYSTESSFNVNDEGGMVEMLKEELAYKAQVAQSVLSAANPLPEMQPVRADIENYRAKWQTYTASYEEFKASMDADKSVRQLDDTQDLGPMLATMWHQGSPYNNLCPMGSGGRCVVGCVATAMAQILDFWHNGSCGSGSHSYNWAGDNSCSTPTPGATLSATFSDGYDWANMANNATSSSPAATQAAVAELSYECGVAVNMMYGHCGSGAYVPGPVTGAFTSYFGMTGSDMNVQARSSYTAATWFTMLQQDLNAGHPGFYTIASHAIVLDGYRVSSGLNQIHLNYGWADGHTNWYTIDGLYCTWSGCNPMVEQVIRGIHPTNIAPPPSSSVTVSAPNGSESWAVGSTHAITWTSSNVSGNVSIELNRAYPTGTWESITTGTANTGSYNWTLAGAASSAARIRVRSVTSASVGDTSNANFSITSTPPAASLTLSAPNGGESWAVGSVHAITWTSSNLSQNVAIELNRAYPTGTWETIIASAANSGSYSWTLAGAASTAARVRIHGTTSPAVGDTSNANFTITSSSGTPTITVTSPNGGEILTASTWYNIHWSSTGLTSTSYVTIQLNRNYPTGTWETISSGTLNDGSYYWPVSGASSTNARIRINGFTNPSITDVSNYSFTIHGTYANSGEGPVEETKLVGAAPNPFNPTTQIRFNLAEATRVKLEVYDITGRQVASLMDAQQEAGAHSVTLDGTNLATGLYFVRMTAGTVHSIQKIQLLK